MGFWFWFFLDAEFTIGVFVLFQPLECLLVAAPRLIRLAADATVGGRESARH